MRLLKNRRGGVDQYVGAILSMLVIIALFVALTAGMKTMNQYNTLNDFGSELAAAAGEAGQCSGSQLDARYNELAAATGIKPDVEYTADFLGASKTVQYGCTITVRLTLQTSISALHVRVPVTLSVCKSVKSLQYWK